jgi:hypothetical protein
MGVEILGVLRNERGPGLDLILARLEGAKAEFTGVVAGMSGSPVYIGDKLVGSVSYRIGQFSKEPIAGITPIEQMLEVRDMPVILQSPATQLASLARTARDTRAEAGQFQPIETPLVMSGFSPEAISLWREKMAGTGLDVVAAGGAAGNGSPKSFDISKSGIASIVPGSAVSAQLVRGDLQLAATCTVTYVDPRQLLACGHPVLQAGPVSLPMTTAEVLLSLASPLNAMKIVNTGEPIGAFTDDRYSAIRGIFGATARMIPVHVSVHGPERSDKLNIEVVDLPSMTPQMLMVSVYQALLTTNQNTTDTSYHVTGNIAMEHYGAVPVDFWAPGGEALPAPMVAALLTGDRFGKFYSNEGRVAPMTAIELNVEAIPHRVDVTLDSARVISSNIVHPGDTVMVEATLRPWQQPARNVRIPVRLPARLQAGTLRVLVSDGSTLDRTLDQPKPMQHQPNISSVVAQAQSQHAQDRVYVSLLVPETQAGMDGQTLTSLPISLANALETMRSAQDVTLNGESAELTADAPAGGVLTGFEVLNIRVEDGSGVN